MVSYQLFGITLKFCSRVLCGFQNSNVCNKFIDNDRKDVRGTIIYIVCLFLIYHFYMMIQNLWLHLCYSPLTSMKHKNLAFGDDFSFPFITFSLLALFSSSVRTRISVINTDYIYKVIIYVYSFLRRALETQKFSFQW